MTPWQPQWPDESQNQTIKGLSQGIRGLPVALLINREGGIKWVASNRKVQLSNRQRLSLTVVSLLPSDRATSVVCPDKGVYILHREIVLGSALVSSCMCDAEGNEAGMRVTNAPS